MGIDNERAYGRAMRLPYLTAINEFYQIFKRYSGYRLPLFVVVTLFANILSGIGISFILPLDDAAIQIQQFIVG